jgi:hypothetical protein
MIPGANILKIALTAIAYQTVSYYAFVSRMTNEIGNDITVYATPVNVVGSLQPVSRALYQTYGLDLSKDYYTFYSSTPFVDVGREVSGDQIIFNSKTLQCESEVNWFDLDGWVGVLCVLVQGSPDA